MLFQKLGGFFLIKFKIIKIVFILFLKGFVLDNNWKHFPSLLITCVLLAIILFIIALIISSIHKKKLNSSQIKEDNKISNKNEEEQ
jgi:uncharacterized membrane protein